ncbi:carbohydrate kinase FGGY [Gluconacetobacter diazotrophicus PA1 5]|uniref:FGGY-family carbohydrate kinase n=1 Tax=Gluconacetobacter diazotrophicus TaxID=33996 RepID=UPI000173BFF5|nr:FGGY-family carbohydrate kinase [Gluconacetobacter diazotrophicus]ACI51945.1 carbohydrate kinase FGGY [Gluconacetobacter diazotrophicus PA1 5]TWB05150.1 sugar (pentulose or hexulose) kinase [Gluconacetobacter diazotrophicus]
MAEAAALGIDLGTSGVRAAVLDARGNVLAVEGARFAVLGAADAPAVWWRALADTLGTLRARLPLDGVRSVTVDGTSGTLVAIDQAGSVIGPASMYHARAADAAVLARIDDLAPPDSPARGAGSPLARAVDMARRPGVRAILHQADWIAGRLRGRFDATDANNALKTGADPDALAWPDWVGGAGLAPGLLPAIHLPGTPLGPVGAEAAALGLPPGAVVHAGTTDGCASFLATGADRAGDAVTALGSTLVVKLLSDVKVDAAAYGIYSHRIGGRYLVGGASNTGGAVLLALFGADRLAALTAALRPDRPTGLEYYPLLRPGERFPVSDPAFPPRLEPRPADDGVFFQGVLEGMAMIEATGYARLEQLGATTLRSVRTVGGGAANAGWTALRQARIGVPFLPSVSEDACVGAARLGLFGGLSEGKAA